MRVKENDVVIFTLTHASTLPSHDMECVLSIPASDASLACQIAHDLAVENERLRKALAFYGLLGNWQTFRDGEILSKCDRDGGSIAVQALGVVPTIKTPGAVR